MDCAEDWMSLLSPQLWDIPLHQLSIPGSHDTMTYCLSREFPISRERSRVLHLLGRFAPLHHVACGAEVVGHADPGCDKAAGRGCAVPGPAHRACALCGSAKNLRFVHMMYSSALVEDTLTEICEWLESHPREVVILACRDFEGMTPELHEYLVGCIKNIFGDALCPRGDIPTLRQLWAREQQVIVSYEDEATVSRHEQLWPGIPYWWANKQDTQDLLHYLDTMKGCGRPGGLFVAGTNLTENPSYVISHPSGSVEKMTLQALPALTDWVCAQLPGQESYCTNIIAGDFVGASSFVSDVIALNRKLLPP